MSRQKHNFLRRSASTLVAAAGLFVLTGGSAGLALRSGAGAPPAPVWPDLSYPAPLTGGGERDAAVIVAIEEYQNSPRLSGAKADAWAWFDYFNKTRGVSGRNITMLLDAEVSVESMREAAARAAGLAGNGGALWFVFIGHGIPDAGSRDGRLEGFDARSSPRGIYARSLSKKELLASLVAGGTGEVVAVFDTCSPGKDAPDRGSAADLGLSEPHAAASAAEPRITVLDAGRTGGCAGRGPGTERPAFNYLVLGGLRGWADIDGDKKIAAAEIAEFAAQAFHAAGEGRNGPAAPAGENKAALADSAGEKRPDMSGTVKLKVPAVNSGSVFRAGPAPGASEWERYSAGLPESEKARGASGWVRDTDWDKLSRMLTYAGSDEDKKDLAAAFVRAYGAKVDENPYVVYLLSFLDMALIPAGGFLRGSPEGEGELDEHPRREVSLAAFCIDKHEVTAADYKKFAAASGRTMPEQPLWSTDHHPVVNVDWNAASDYCAWAGKRLPAEAEWEKAARGGADTKYSFGGDESKLGDYAWYHVNSGGQSHPVGLKNPNQYGVYDMAGNVWEWTADRYGVNYYRTAPSENPKGPDSGAQRVLRGGSWNFFDISQRPGDRAGDSPSSKSERGGFRCAF
jgi:hypothetical protein